MREIGGYIEFEHYSGEILHGELITLNCGRNALAYLIKSRGIRKIKIPYFICGSIINVCQRENVFVSFYHIDSSFKPLDELSLDNDEWLYLVNFYGQLSNTVIKEYAERYTRVIVDQANGYFEDPLSGIDTIYTCRKWFGVADGAFLSTDSILNDDLIIDESYDRMGFLLGRFERTASEFYEKYADNNRFFADEPIKHMSKLTENLLRAIDYADVFYKRAKNFKTLHEAFAAINHLDLKDTLFMYPLLINDGMSVKRKLQERKIYIPTLWPDVFNITDSEDIEYKLARDILPLPIDQRYGIDDMDYLINEVIKCIN